MLPHLFSVIHVVTTWSTVFLLCSSPVTVTGCISWLINSPWPTTRQDRRLGKSRFTTNNVYVCVCMFARVCFGWSWQLYWDVSGDIIWGASSTSRYRPGKSWTYSEISKKNKTDADFCSKGKLKKNKQIIPETHNSPFFLMCISAHMDHLLFYCFPFNTTWFLKSKAFTFCGNYSTYKKLKWAETEAGAAATQAETCWWWSSSLAVSL